MFLDPGKLLIIGVVALVVLGPDQLPKVARTVGSLWHDFTRWRVTLDEQVRGAFPDLPPTHEIVAAVRSPIALLDRLAKESAAPATAAPAPAAPGGSDVEVGAQAGAVADTLLVTPIDPWDAWPGTDVAGTTDSSAPDSARVPTDVSMN